MVRTSVFAALFTVGYLSVASAAMVDYRATMTGKSEVPPTTSNASGDVLATLDTSTKKLNYTITYMGLSGPATAAHFHGPADAGANVHRDLGAAGVCDQAAQQSSHPVPTMRLITAGGIIPRG